MKVIFTTIGITSVCWFATMVYVLIRNSVKNRAKDKEIAQLKYTCNALQAQFALWRKQYEKMETGNVNNDFLGSLDILQHPTQNDNGKTKSARAATR